MTRNRDPVTLERRVAWSMGTRHGLAGCSVSLGLSLGLQVRGPALVRVNEPFQLHLELRGDASLLLRDCVLLTGQGTGQGLLFQQSVVHLGELKPGERKCVQLQAAALQPGALAADGLCVLATALVAPLSPTSKIATKVSSRKRPLLPSPAPSNRALRFELSLPLQLLAVQQEASRWPA
jgi:hypothetical protein